ncbi:MAG: GTP-binding protein [Candidatus Lokiarchaeota archaeon]|nr:GTP-binding protein [Candidatus Lokiarchaeota archaeon]MBD3342055.1 GTP-binding protein [Candidatus Lokiarchaeota archaeon]
MDKKPRVLNVLIAGHSQHGKSSLIEVIVGKFPDNLDYELAHGTTVSLKVIQFQLKKNNLLINFLDTPGHADFKGGIALGLDIADLLVLVISGSEGFQARTYWLVEKAIEKKLPFIVAATKMDLPFADVEKIHKELNKLLANKVPVIGTSAKEVFGIEPLMKKIAIYVRKRKNLDVEPSFMILGYNQRKGIGELLDVMILSGTLKKNDWISDKIKIRMIFSLEGNPLSEVAEGEIVQFSLNVNVQFELGTKYLKGKFISSKVQGLLSEIEPRKEFYITVENKEKFNVALEALKEIKRIIPSFDFYVEKSKINILVLGDVQFDFIKNKLEALVEFKIVGSKLKGIITINKPAQGRHNTAKVRIQPRFRKKLTITRNGKPEKKLFDVLGASTAYNAFHLDGLHVDIISGKNEGDIAQAIAKAIEKIKVIKIIPRQDIIVKVENYHNIFSLIEKYDIEVLYQSQTNTFFLQVKNKDFEDFFNSLMKVSEGKAQINLFKFNQGEIILSVDPGTRHIGFCLIERGELPSLWYVNLKKNIKHKKFHNIAYKQLIQEMDIFLGEGKELVNKIFIGNGPGAEFIIDFFIEYFRIPCENKECVISDLENDVSKDINKDITKGSFEPPDIYLVDEFKTTKESLFHLQRGELVSEVKTKGFVDHAIAALLIAKRGIKGEIVKIEKKPLTQLYDHVIENYSGTYSFATLHNVRAITDLQKGMHLRIKNNSKLDTSSLNDGDIITFLRFGSNYKNFVATTLSGNHIIIKFQSNVNIKKEFFDILSPVKQRN